MFLLVDSPILNSPFEEPTRYWAYEEGQPVIREGRRPAGYYLKPRTRGPQVALLEEEFVPLERVNTNPGSGRRVAGAKLSRRHADHAATPMEQPGPEAEALALPVIVLTLWLMLDIS